jgi:hypothetical protein
MAHASTNWVPNPSFEVNTTGWTIGGGATSALVTDLAFSGTHALQLTDTETNGAFITLATGIPVTPGQGVYVAIRALARQANAMLTLSIEFQSGTGPISGVGNVTSVNITTNSNDWTTATYFMEAPATAISTTMYVIVETTTGGAIGDKWLLDAAELRIDEPLDGYFDGDTPDSEWLGTAHNSASFRNVTPFVFAQDHSNDDIEVLYRVYSVDDNLNIEDELTDWVDNGEIKSSVDDAVKRTASIDFKNLAVLTPFVTRLKVYMEMYRENILVRNDPLGVFSIEMPDGDITYEHRYGTVDASDITVELADSARSKQFVYNKGTNIVQNAEDRITIGRGMKANFPADSRKFSKKEKFPQWMGDLELVNKLLAMANMQGCYGDGNGVITTKKIRKLSQMHPVAKILQHQVMSLEETNNTDQLCNVVKVYKDNPDKTPIFAMVRNTDPADPVSIVNMRYKTLVISDSEIEDNGDALELATAKLEEGKSFDKTLTLEVAPMPWIGIGNVVDLTFDMADGTCYCGRYWVREWSLPLGPPFWMKLDINRIQKFHDGFPEDEY